jgi:hypothetical protein
LLAVRLSPDETAMHRLLEDYTLQVWAEGKARGDSTACLLSILLRKRALSSAHALALSIERRLALLGSGAPLEMQLLLPLLDEDTIEDTPGDGLVGALGLADQVHERRLLDALHQSAVRAAAAETKIRVLARFLARAGEPAIVFTEYRDTLARLAAHLPKARLRLHGGMLPREREDVQAAFATDGGTLLATDAASEGLNLHHRCRLVVHYELPWNPMRLEQRAGRVDRLGQQRRVHEVMLVARHTAERLVLAPLIRRIRAAPAIQHGERLDCLSESDIAAAIIEDRPAAAAGPATPPSTPPPDSLAREGVAESDRLRGCRRAGITGRVARPDAILLRPRGGRETLSVVLRVTGTTAGGRHLASVLVPLRIDTGATITLSPPAADSLITRLAPQFTRSVAHYWSGHAPWDGWAQVLAALIAREQSIRAVVTSPARELVQAGLFDRRAQAEADARRQATTDWHDQADARIVRLSEHREVRCRIEVVAISEGELDEP